MPASNARTRRRNCGSRTNASAGRRSTAPPGRWTSCAVASAASGVGIGRSEFSHASDVPPVDRGSGSGGGGRSSSRRDLGGWAFPGTQRDSAIGPDSRRGSQRGAARFEGELGARSEDDEIVVHFPKDAPRRRRPTEELREDVERCALGFEIQPAREVHLIDVAARDEIERRPHACFVDAPRLERPRAQSELPRLARRPTRGAEEALARGAVVGFDRDLAGPEIDANDRVVTIPPGPADPRGRPTLASASFDGAHRFVGNGADPSRRRGVSGVARFAGSSGWNEVFARRDRIARDEREPRVLGAHRRVRPAREEREAGPPVERSRDGDRIGRQRDASNHARDVARPGRRV